MHVSEYQYHVFVMLVRAIVNGPLPCLPFEV